MKRVKRLYARPARDRASQLRVVRSDASVTPLIQHSRDRQAPILDSNGFTKRGNVYIERCELHGGYIAYYYHSKWWQTRKPKERYGS